MLGFGQVPSFHDGQEQADRLFALATDRLMYRRERGIHVRGQVDVIERALALREVFAPIRRRPR